MQLRWSVLADAVRHKTLTALLRKAGYYTKHRINTTIFII